MSCSLILGHISLSLQDFTRSEALEGVVKQGPEACLHLLPKGVAHPLHHDNVMEPLKVVVTALYTFILLKFVYLHLYTFIFVYLEPSYRFRLCLLLSNTPFALALAEGDLDFKLRRDGLPTSPTWTLIRHVGRFL